MVTGLGDVLNPNVTLHNCANPGELRQMRAMLFSVLNKNVRFIQGQSIVKRHLPSMDGRACYEELATHCINSPTAELHMDSLRDKVMANTLTGHAGTYEKWITQWFDDAYNYNNNLKNPADRLSDASLKKFLCNAVAGVKDLATVRLRELEHMALTGKLYTYDEYSTALVAIAQQLDQSAARARRVNLHTIDDTQDRDADATTSDMSDYDLLIHQARRRSFNPRLNKDTWNSLEPTDQSAWDTLSDSAKASILSYKQTRDSQHTASRTANQHLAHDHDDSGAGAPDEAPSDAELKINETKGAVHPGNISRVLSDKGAAVKSTKKSVSINVTDTTPSRASERHVSMAVRRYDPLVRDPITASIEHPRTTTLDDDELSLAISEDTYYGSTPPPLQSPNASIVSIPDSLPDLTDPRTLTGYDSDNSSWTSGLPDLINRHHINDDDDDDTVSTCVSTDDETSLQSNPDRTAYSAQIEEFYCDDHCDDATADALSVRHGEFYCDDAIIPTRPPISLSTYEGEMTLHAPTAAELQSQVWRDAENKELQQSLAFGTLQEVDVASTNNEESVNDKESVTTGTVTNDWESYRGWDDWLTHHQFADNDGEYDAEHNEENPGNNGESGGDQNPNEKPDFQQGN